MLLHLIQGLHVDVLERLESVEMDGSVIVVEQQVVFKGRVWVTVAEELRTTALMVLV